MLYIFTPFQKALEVGLTTENTTRRLDNKKEWVILIEDDFSTYNPLIEIEESEDGELSERYASDLKEKADTVGGYILTQEQSLKEVSKPNWIEQ